ncbi:hypothetical protein CK203_085488 [Vitis vinifera]|uniref:Uncharacterized protein n=1 Tax=Vitis vinifera TaxID=29760 RepID=A0A438C2H3_VITVI|nr:hypothetical protein CK203_085488 [Vitis vinifera]
MCMEKSKGGALGIRRLSLLNKTLFYGNRINGMLLKEEPFGIKSLVENMGRKREDGGPTKSKEKGEVLKG